MASVFQQGGRQTWSAQIRVWDAAQARFKWRKVATGCKDKSAALEAALKLERLSLQGKAGDVPQERVAATVSAILDLAGAKMTGGAPPFVEFAGAFLEARMKNVSQSTARKYSAHWTALQKWAGDRIKLPVDHWNEKLCSEYYSHLQAKFSQTTANDHLRTLAMVLLRAQAAGHIRGNPVALVERVSNDSVEKQAITREEFDALIKAMKDDEPWRCLTLLGWHTGHRLQDLLSLTSANVRKSGKWDVIEFAPQKKRGKGRTVVLPIPEDVAKALQKVGDFKALNGANNRNGVVSNQFVLWLGKAGIDPVPDKRKGSKRTVHLKSFHSFRHAMASRLVAAGVSGELARLVTDHESAKVHKSYVHAEVEALAGALQLTGDA